MEVLYERCCGLDVHKKEIVACLRIESEEEIRRYGCSTPELLEMADWLLENECEMIAMESTSSYWKPVYNMCEACGLDAMVVNAQHMKNVPGKKTDVNDAQWIADLLQHGLLQPSFIPPKSQRENKEMCQYRKSLIKMRSSELNRLQKMLEGANIKLSGTISDINGKSGRALLELVLNGEIPDVERIRQLREDKVISSRIKASDEQLARDLQGFVTPIQAKMLEEVLKHIDELTIHINELSNDIDNFMNGDQHKAVELLSTIPGVSTNSAEDIISVIGTDMSRFPTSNHLCSWAGVAPGNNESAGKKKSSRTTQGNVLLKTTLVICAHSAVRKKDSYLGALHKRIYSHRGKGRAIMAVAHSILNSIYYMLKRGEPYQDLGSDYFDQQHKEKKIKGCLKKLQSFGVDVSAISVSG